MPCFEIALFVQENTECHYCCVLTETIHRTQENSLQLEEKCFNKDATHKTVKKWGQKGAQLPATYLTSLVGDTGWGKELEGTRA